MHGTGLCFKESGFDIEQMLVLKKIFRSITKGTVVLRAINKKARAFAIRELEKNGYVPRRSAQNGPRFSMLPIFIEHFVQNGSNKSILQIGANDGLLDDPIHHVIRNLKLPAILVEPLPELFEQLKHNYADQPQVRFENVAVSNRPGIAQLFHVDTRISDLPDWVKGLASFDKSILLKHRTFIKGCDLEKLIETINVPVMTISEILQRHIDVKDLLLLQVDTEGHDYAVVQSAIEANILPDIINYEHIHLTYEDQTACRQLLAAHGYSFCSTDSDTMACKSSLIAPLKNDGRS